MHPAAGGRYAYDVAGRTVYADSAHVGDMLAGGLRTWEDRLVADALAPAQRNDDIDETDRALLPWALTTVSAHSPSSLGLAGRAAYSGPGATSLLGNLGHSRRGYAFAAELITAACLVYRAWLASDDTTLLGNVRDADARLDFGVKLVGVGTARRTVEADILLSHPDGRRVAVDVKTSRAGAYRTPPSREMLEIVRQAIARQEITSFHFVTRGRFRNAVKAAVADIEGIYVHEAVWPPRADRESIYLQQAAAIDYGRAISTARCNGILDFDRLSEELSSEAAAAYRRTTGDERSLLEVPLRFTYLFDETTPIGDGPGSRVIAAWGRTPPQIRRRDRRFMAGYPLPRADTTLDRGHLIAREAGGDEGVGINLIPQDRRLNRGHGADGRRWRRLERLAAANPGCGLFVRALYDDASDIPVTLEYLLVALDGLVQIERFRNRPGAP